MPNILIIIKFLYNNYYIYNNEIDLIEFKHSIIYFFMLNIIKSKVKNVNKNKLKQKNFVLNYKNYVPAVREWKNSVYAYNKNYISLIPTASKLTIKLIRSYFNSLNKKIERKLRKDRIRKKLIKKSSNKIYLSDGEFKHTNDKVIITLFVYNRQRINLLSKLKKLYKRILRKKVMLRRINLIKKALSRLLINKWKRYLLFKEIISNRNIRDNIKSRLDKRLSLLNIEKRLNRKLLKRIKYCLYYKQLIYINKLKFSNVYLSGLTNALERIYKKSVEFNIINLKSFFANTDILIQPLKYKLRKKRKLMRYLNRFIRRVKVQPVKIIDQPEYFFDNKKLLCINEGDKLFNDFIMHNKTNSNNLKKTILSNIKYKRITGVKISAAGRLTRRYTAARSKHKIKYQGNFKNIYASIKGHSYVLLRSRLQPNLDYNRLSYKTRIGSFGLKGWVSGS